MMRRRDQIHFHCCVKGCLSKSTTNSDLSFHQFPKANKGQVTRTNLFGKKEKLDRLKQWPKVLKIKHPLPSMKVCSLHFVDTDFQIPNCKQYFPDLPTKRKDLLNTAVPSMNLPLSEKEKENGIRDEARLNRLINRRLSQQYGHPSIPFSSNISVDGDNTVSVENLLEEHQNYVQDDVESSLSNKDVSEEHSRNQEQIIDLENEEEQDGNSSLLDDPLLALMMKNNENSDNEKHCYKFMDTLDSDTKMCTATGLATIKILDTIVDMIKLVHGNKFDSQNFKTRDKVILTYMKLKHNMSYRLLALIFVKTAESCEKIFASFICILNNVLSVAIQWPSRESISKNLPMCFQGFENTRVVLDCTEIFIQSSKDLSCQLKTYSHYKGGNTVKFMTGVSPAGVITFVSPAYGGRASDTAIFSKSKLIDLLESGDGVMVDRGFLIDELCIKKRWKLIRPPFLQDKKQFSGSESILTSKIAAARVHCERVNQRIKVWAIGGSKMPASLVYLADEIMSVLCATVNLSNPVLNDDRFMKL